MESITACGSRDIIIFNGFHGDFKTSQPPQILENGCDSINLRTYAAIPKRLINMEDAEAHQQFLSKFDFQKMKTEDINISLESEDSIEGIFVSTSEYNDHDYLKHDTPTQEYYKQCLESSVSFSSSRTGSVCEDIFLQNENCSDTAFYLPQCRECNKSPVTSKYCCRFFEFRKLRIVDGNLTLAGFSDPHTDPNDYDHQLWMVSNESKLAHLQIDTESPRYILSYIATQFCELIEEEQSSLNLYKNKVVGWKRSVQGVRETCDVCETSIFNYHWTCGQCGFCVCLDCFRERMKCFIRVWSDNSTNQLSTQDKRDSFYWFYCTTDEEHDFTQLFLTQIIPGDALEILNKQLHETCRMWGITDGCGCELIKNCSKKSASKEMQAMEGTSMMDKDILLKEIVKGNIQKNLKLKTKMSITESKFMYPNVNHSWHCNGRLLRLQQPVDSDESYMMFQHQWEQGRPVMVSNVTKNMNMSIWDPRSFSEQFGDKKNDLVDCVTHRTIPKQPMRTFWKGFWSMKDRLLDKHTDRPLTLKLKDWPPGDDFSEIIPEHFRDIMSALPLSHYTQRDGKYNLASHLPQHFVRPDLGPKMYSAYGSANQLSKGTTNLHLDVSDAINVLVHVSMPIDAFNLDDYSTKSVWTAISDAGADYVTRMRYRDENKLAGAIWHIYDPQDARSIRALLTDYSKSNGKPPGQNSDPIHDQTFYLDSQMRKDLLEKYDVEGYCVIQLEGDAVFIPAGAPHQVRNLYDCIKVAEDFVSPENIRQCFSLTEEFRDLSDTHSNHEDKLQVKNILYHTVKDIVRNFGSE